MQNAVPNGSSIAFSYLSGETYALFDSSGIHQIFINQRDYFAPGSFTVAFGATVVVTNLTGITWASGTAYFLQIEKAAVTAYGPIAITGNVSTPLGVTGTLNNYLETNIQNLSSGVNASSDIVCTADTGTATTNYIDFGINGSGYTGGVLGSALEGYLYTSDQSLNIGAIGGGKVVRILAGGSSVGSNTAATFSSTGLDVNGNITAQNIIGPSVDGVSNLTIVASRSGNAETIAIKTKAGTDPTSTDSIAIGFRDTVSNTGGYIVRTITASNSLTIPSTADLGTKANAAVAVTIASPGVVTYANHGMRPDDTFVLSTTGALPTGLTAGTTYYVSRTGFVAGGFQISATAGGASINTTGTQSGVHAAAQTPKPFRVWVVLADDAGVIRLGVIYCASANIPQYIGSTYPLRDDSVTSSTAIAGLSNSSQTFYSGAAWTSKPTRVIGYIDYTLSVGGAWNAAPTTMQIWGKGMRLPGDVVQRVRTTSSTVATTAATTGLNSGTIPLSSSGAQFMAIAISPTASANLLRAKHSSIYSNSPTDTVNVMLCRDSDMFAASVTYNNGASYSQLVIDYFAKCSSVASTTFAIRAGPATTGTTTFNGVGGVLYCGGVTQAFLEIEEIVQ